MPSRSTLAAHLVPDGAAVLAQLPPEHAAPARARRSARPPRPWSGRGWPPRRSAAVRPGKRGPGAARPASARCASEPATGGQPTSAAKARHAAAPAHPGRGRVERLDAVGVEDAGPPRPCSRRIVRSLAQQRVGHQRVRHDRRCRPARGRAPRSPCSDCQGRMRFSRNSPTRWPPRVVISSPTMISMRSPRARRDALRRHGRVDALVVGDGDHVQVARRDGLLEDLLHARDAVRGQRVDVQVRAPDGLDGPRRSRGPPAGRSRGLLLLSSQMGNDSVHHCSGAMDTIRSNASHLPLQDVRASRSRRPARPGPG